MNGPAKAWFWAPWSILCVLLWLPPTSFGQDQPKYIRLRNELIATSASDQKKASMQVLAVDQPASGLYLVQFTDRLQAPWREQLRKLGVELVRFVPDDAFIARLATVRLRQLQALPFVRWAGEYRPELKISHSLQGPLPGRAPTNTLAVSVLLAPGRSAADLVQFAQPVKALRVQFRSAMGTVVHGQVNAAELAALARSESVLWIEPAPRMRLTDEIASKIVAGGEIPTRSPEGASASDPTGPVEPQPSPAHDTVTQQLGYAGQGVSVAVADSGLANGDAQSMHPDLADRVDGFLFYGSLHNAADEHGHGTHVAGIIAGNGATGEMDDAGALYGLGVAPKAHLVVQRIFDADGQDAMPPYENLTHDAVRAGAVIGSNSWGDDVQGRYNLSAAQFDALVRDADAETPGEQPYILEFSAGNAGPGPQTLDSPAVAKNVIATGASQNDRRGFFIYADGPDAVADFSSRGPCEDGRIKPDVVAPGTWIASLQSSSAGDGNAWSPISGNYQYQGGTSQAGPHVAGAAAVFVQYYRETHANVTPSPALVKAALINSAVDMDDKVDTGPIPNFDEGWGRVALTNLIGSNRRLEYVDQTELLSTGETYEHRIVVAGSGEPLKITLVYTDMPGLPAALPALVNDLDLEVVGPDGALYRGNQFIDGASVAGATSSDSINNVEAVHLLEPAAGDYLIRVRARNVVEDIHYRGDIAPQQDFAMVVSGDVSAPGVGVMVLDRDSYTAPGLIQVKLIDTDLVGQASVKVLLKSSTEISGELLALRPSGSPGVFTGAVATALGPAVTDGRLQIQNGDSIEAIYQDASPVAVRTVQARADLVPPAMSHLTVTNRLGRELISWQTDEPARAQVFYGTNLTQMLSATNASLQVEQQIALDGLSAGRSYLFYAVSEDEAGNLSTNDNGGQFFSFVAQPTATVLLVDAYVPDDPQFQTVNIPVTSYTDALDKTGVSYEVWRLKEPADPPPGPMDLRPFRVVIWRLSDSLLGNASLTAAQQSALQAYLHGGGSLLLTSMELLSRLGTNSLFVTNTLQVQAVAVDIGVPAVYGLDNDPISNGMVFNLDYSAYRNDIVDQLGLSPDAADTLTLSTNAAPIFLDSISGGAAGLRYPRSGHDSPGRLVFLSFPFDAVPDSGEAPNNRASLLRRILGFLAPGVGGLGTITLDRAAYALPDLITIEVADSDLAGQGRTAVRAFSSSLTNGIPVALFETARKGFFRGSVTVGLSTAAAPLGHLPAKAGDVIWVEYADASSAEVVRAQATVDIQHPKISSITVQPGYEQATVRWATSEPTDALVQFGESTFLGRTAYKGEFEESHDLTLVGLQTDRLYYYQIVDRDLAGNTSVNDNQTKLYTFRTLQPLLPPFSDGMDVTNTAKGWSVENGATTLASWMLGPPHNGRETAAHSPLNCWGSNLDGAPIDTADTMLVGPALQLAGGNVATLRFWHSYDFSDRSDADIYEYGRLYISTNSSAGWVQLKEYTEASTGWEQEQIDLTPYVGRVVRFGWSYEFFTLEARERPGWLIDDISVNVTNLLLSTIQVTNNLAEASFALTGPISRSGQGWRTLFTNVPAGQYVVRFSDVPFYQTPPPQTNTVAGNSLLIEGHYTFADINQNGISDAWEQHYFGAVSSSHPPGTDSDGDGFSDYAEFIAGTDPTDPNSGLHVFAPARLNNGPGRVSWQAYPGRNYRLLSSTNATAWVPLSGWLRATSSQLSYAVPLTNAPVFFQVEVNP